MNRRNFLGFSLGSPFAFLRVTEKEVPTQLKKLQSIYEMFSDFNPKLAKLFFNLYKQQSIYAPDIKKHILDQDNLTADFEANPLTFNRTSKVLAIGLIYNNLIISKRPYEIYLHNGDTLNIAYQLEVILP